MSHTTLPGLPLGRTPKFTGPILLGREGNKVASLPPRATPLSVNPALTPLNLGMGYGGGAARVTRPLPVSPRD